MNPNQTHYSNNQHEKRDTFHDGTIIKVIGVGGAGGNAVDYMIRSGVKGVQFIAANTDAQSLSRSLADVKIQLGKSGLGAGSKPEVGKKAAQESIASISEAIEGAHMVFITAGMGGGTGTGAAPIVAQIAKEKNILVVGVVTKPFDFENRMRAAEGGLEEIGKYVDSLIVVLNDKLLEVYGDEATMDECFNNADNVLCSAVGGISEIINVPGLVNVDFQDVTTAMAEMGRAMMGSAEATGADRAKIAAEKASSSPLLEGKKLSGARCVLINITANKSLKMSEVRDAVKTVQGFAAPEAFIKYGTVFDESMDDRIRVTIVATGLGVEHVLKKETSVVMEVVKQTGTYGGVPTPSVQFEQPKQETQEMPFVVRNKRTAESMASQGFSHYDIPAFLRKQAD